MHLTAEKLEVFIQKGSIFEKVPLKEDIFTNLKSFLTQASSSSLPGFCCVDFVNLLFEKFRKENLNEFDAEQWSTYTFEEKELVEGDAIATGIKKEHETSLNHFAMYLGSGLYLSVGGINGDLIITGLEPMKKMYEANSAMLLCPKKLDFA